VTRLAAVLLAAWTGWGATAGAQAVFFATVSDLPLMPGLTESAETALVFDNPSGRIVEVAATGAVSATTVRSFYGETLPQLGWVADGKRFRREGEVLTLTVKETAVGVTVGFSIAPGAP
jgi:hypothetical protein